MKNEHHEQCGGGETHCFECHKLPHQATGAHASSCFVVGHAEYANCYGGCNYACQCGRNKDERIFYNIAYLQHGGAQALCYESANAIFSIADAGKAYHLG